MASNSEIQFVSLPLTSFSGATGKPLVKLPDGYGGITVLEVNLVGASTAGTSVGGLLVSMSDAGTPVISGTIATFAGTVVTTAAGVFEATMSTTENYVDAGEWIGFDQTSGTVPAGALIAISYITGQA